MAFYHAGRCDCPVGCCDCGPETKYTHGVEYWNTCHNEWCTMHFESRDRAVGFMHGNWDEIKRLRLANKLGRKPRVFKLVENSDQNAER